MASLALKSSASAFSGLSICPSSGLKSVQSKTACRGTQFAVARAGESQEQDEQIVSRRFLSIAAAAAIALSNQPTALAARRGTGKAEEIKEKKPEDDPKLSALEKRAIVKARQLEELKAKVAKEKAKASEVASPANIQSNVATSIEKAKEAVPTVEQAKEAVPSSFVDKVKNAVEATPLASGSGSAE